MELTLDQALKKGVEAHKAGKVQEADRYYTAILKANPKHPDANHNMGVLAVGVGKVEEALPFFKRALEANPSLAQFWLSYIDALIKLNRMDEAKSFFEQAKSKGAKGESFDKMEDRLGLGIVKIPKVQEPHQNELQRLITLYTEGHYKGVLTLALKLLKEFPNSVNLYNISGAANQRLGKLEDAVEAYNKALSIKPDYAEAYNNMGVALKDQGKLEEAVEAYNKALSIKPDYADAHLNIGNALQECGKLGEAIKAFKEVIYSKPEYALAYYNMGNALQKQGKLYEAIEAYYKAISIKPNYPEAFNNMGHALESFIFTEPNRDFQKIITSLLTQKNYVMPRAIARAAISLLKFEKNLQRNLKFVGSEIIQNPIDVACELSELPLLMKLMSVCPLPDLKLEKLFENLRRSILLNILDMEDAPPDFIRFQSALALQCFTNEYIYSYCEKEDKSLRDLEQIVENTLQNKKQPSSQAILALASYKALNNYDWSGMLIVTEQIQEVFARHVLEPQRESKLKKDFPIFEEITNHVSSAVREQYEENPYPRWINLRSYLKPISISEVVGEIKLKLEDEKIKDVKNPKILIAGCGTGQHSIAAATRFKFSEILAVDLSLSSLAYAKRKTAEIGIENIDYMQADILDLANLKKRFDIIESVGVLHHMDSPMAGWKILADCLKPGGLMKIGLYSELGREHIVKIRQETRELGIESSNAEMRSFRDMIINSDKDHHKQVLNFPDFYSLSEFRDLLFHVQEHRFTIPQIQDHLGKLGLKFCGFEVPGIISHFSQTNKAKDDPYDLDKWHVYETVNPRAFEGMYQFWCQSIH